MNVSKISKRQSNLRFLCRFSETFGPFPDKYKRDPVIAPSTFASALGYQRKYVTWAKREISYKELKDKVRDLFYVIEEEDVHFAEVYYDINNKRMVILYYYS